MPEQPTQETINQMNRWFAAQCNNRAWDLTAKPDRSPAEDQEMLYSAYGAAYHWAKVGKPVNNARAEMALAHVHSLLGHSDLALQYARSCLAYFEANGGEDWDFAFAHAELAYAAAVAGDAALHARHYTEAKARGAAIREEEDRKIFLSEFARIPDRVSGK